MAETMDTYRIENLNASQSPLLRLPTEVRLHVLTYILTPPSLTQLKPEDTTNIHLFSLMGHFVASSQQSKSSGDIHWKHSRAVLSTCRWIRAEGRDIFYRLNTFVLESPLIKVTQCNGVRWCSRWMTPLRFTTPQEPEETLLPFNPPASNDPDNHIPRTILERIEHVIFLTNLSINPEALSFYNCRQLNQGFSENPFTLEIADMRPFQAMKSLRSFHTYLWAAFDFVCNTCYPGPTRPLNPRHFHEGNYPIVVNALRPLQALCEALPLQCRVKFESLSKLRQQEPGTATAWCGPNGNERVYKSEMANRLLDCFTESQQVQGVNINGDQGKLNKSDFDHRICGVKYETAKACPVAIPGVSNGCVHANMRLRAVAAGKQRERGLQEIDYERGAEAAAANVAASRPLSNAPKKLPWVDQI